MLRSRGESDTAEQAATKSPTGTPALMRAINDRAALAIMLDHQPLSRNQLSALAAVSKPTASQMVRRLESGGFIEAVGRITGSNGPTTAIFGVRTQRLLGVAIDIQADRFFSTIVDVAGTEYATAELPRPDDQGGRTALDELYAAVDAACLANRVNRDAVSALSVGLQASVDPRADELVLAHELSGWPTTGVRASLEGQTGWSVDLYNDANLAAVAEYAQGAAHEAHSFALLWLGIGLGFAVNLGGRVLYGSRGSAGEIGRLRVPAENIGLGGSSVQLDDLLAWSVLEGMAARHGMMDFSIDTAAELLVTHEGRKPFFAELAPRVALAIPPALAVLDPEMIVLGGPIGAAGGPYLARLVREHVAREFPLAPEIRNAAITTHPVLVGAREILTATIRARLLDESAALEPR